MTIEELFGTLQQSIVAEWRKHLKTSKYSKHMALDEFYTEMPELIDALIEDYNSLNANYEALETQYEQLQSKKQELQNNYDELSARFTILENNYNELNETVNTANDGLESVLNGN